MSERQQLADTVRAELRHLGPQRAQAGEEALDRLAQPCPECAASERGQDQLRDQCERLERQILVAREALREIAMAEPNETPSGTVAWISFCATMQNIAREALAALEGGDGERYIINDGLTTWGTYSLHLGSGRYAAIEIPAGPLTQEDADRLSEFLATLVDEGGDGE